MPTGTAKPLQQPRRRILQAALELVASGGYEALQVARDRRTRGCVVAHDLRQLPVARLAADRGRGRAVAGAVPALHGVTPRGRTPAVRVDRLITDLTATMTANRALTVALLRALLSGKRDVSQYVHGFGGVLQSMLASAIAPDGPTPRDREVAELLESIWFAALVGWATGTSTDADIARIMQRAARLLLPAS